MNATLETNQGNTHCPRIKKYDGKDHFRCKVHLSLKRQNDISRICLDVKAQIISYTFSFPTYNGLWKRRDKMNNILITLF